MFLSRLLARTLGESPALTPRRASRFEDGDSTFEERVEEIATSPRKPPIEAEQAVPEQRPKSPRTSSEVAQPEPPRPPADDTPHPPPHHHREVHEVHTVEERLASIAPPPAAAPPQERTTAPPPTPGSKHKPTREQAPEPARSELSELRIEQHSIERRFETLVREHTVERVREITRSEQPLAKPTTPREQAPSQSLPPRNPAPLPPTPPSRRAALSQRANPEPAPAPEPIVHVTIGRVEVRAVQAPAASKPSARPREPRLGLDDYLARRERR